MGWYAFAVIIMRMIVPGFIGLSVMLRPSIISVVYLATLCYVPFINVANERKLKTGAFRYVMVYLPYQMTAIHIGFYLYTRATDELEQPENENMKRLLKNVGMTNISEFNMKNMICWYGPEAFMFIASASHMWAVKMITRIANEEKNYNWDAVKLRCVSFIIAVSKFWTIVLLFTIAMLNNNFFGLFYFLLFLFLMSCWALNKDVPRLLSIVLLLSQPVPFVQVVFMYIYQTEIVHTTIPSNTTVLRYLGIEKFIEKGPGDSIYFIYSIEECVYPVCTYLLYYFMVTQGTMLITQKNIRKGKSLTSLRRRGRSKRNVESRKEDAKEVSAQNRWSRLADAIKQQAEKAGKRRHTVFMLSDEQKGNISSKIKLVVRSVFEAAGQYSHIGCIMVTMMWSVTFINKLSLALMVWAIVLWIIPKQRLLTQYTMVLMVLYAYADMLYHYLLDINVFAMMNIRTLSFIQFISSDRVTTIEICLKAFYTLMFWVMGRSYLQQTSLEFVLPRLSFHLPEVIAPDAEALRHLGRTAHYKHVAKNYLMQCWIALLVLYVALVSLSGERMNIFRITSTLQYVTFMTLLVVNFWVWRRLLYVIVVVMLCSNYICVLAAYLYEVELISQFLEQLGIPESWHGALGLFHIETARVFFARMISPTLYIMMCMIQLLFFHKPFMEMTDPDDVVAALEEEYKKDLLGDRMRAWMDLTHTMLLLFEHYLLNVLILCLALMSIDRCCVMGFLLMATLCFSMPFGRPVQVSAIKVSALIIGLHRILRMVYCLEVFKEEDWDVTCNATRQFTGNTASWIGLWKTNRERRMGLMTYAIWPIINCLVWMLYTVVDAKLYIFRDRRGLSTCHPKVVFPEVTHQEANLSLGNYVKYAVNYGFYRMGYEFTLIWLAAVIAIRQDGYSIIYSGWMCILLIIPRCVLRYIWGVFVLFLVFTVLFHYVMAVGAPPWWCMEYEWERGGHYWRSVQHFWKLVDNHQPQSSHSMIPDFLLLIIASNQLKNFRTEIKYGKSKDYEGGSNDSVVGDFERRRFKNPYPDFTTYTTSYLDILKRYSFSLSSWGVAMVVFLGSVNTGNIFSFFYLPHVFIFCWHGDHFYCKRLRSNIKRCNVVIAMNVLIMSAKSCLQILGCFYAHLIPRILCPVVHALAIVCVRTPNEASYFDELEEARGWCSFTDDELSGIRWDAAIFAALILQKRVILSYNYFHLLEDAKASLIVQKRGMQIMQERQEDRIEALNEEQRRISERIALKHQMVAESSAEIQELLSGNNTLWEDLDKKIAIEIIPPEKTVTALDQGYSVLLLFDDMIARDMRYAVHNHWRRTNEHVITDTSTDDEEPYTTIVKIIYFFRFIWTSIDALVVSITAILNGYTVEYTQVNEELRKEKRILKENTDYYKGARVKGWWLPRAPYEKLLLYSKLDNPIEPPKEISREGRSNLTLLVEAVWAFTFAKSDLYCYIFIILSQIIRSELIIMPLTLMVWFWGALSNPRPSKTFWIIMISYLELVIILKMVFQCRLMPGNIMRGKIYYNEKMKAPNVLYPLHIFGLYKRDYYYLWEMFIYIAVLLHRNYLTRLGLWTTSKLSPAPKDGDYVVEDKKLVPVSTVGTATDDVITVRRSKLPRSHQMASSQLMVNLQYWLYNRIFYHRLWLHTSQIATDYYTLMFLFSLVQGLIITFSHKDFSTEGTEDDLISFFATNTLPAEFTMMVFAHFMVLIVDRCIYVRKNVLAKLIFYLAQLALLHFWVFFMLPVLNSRQTNQTIAPVLYYLASSFYLLVSAFQIRCGYPRHTWDFFYCHSYTRLNICLHEIYFFVPFLFELRATIDYLFSGTSLQIFSFWTMSFLYPAVTSLKCKRTVNKQFQSPPGVKKKSNYKCMWGIPVVAFFIFIFWLPLLLFTWGTKIGEPNIPSAAELIVNVPGKAGYLYQGKAKVFRYRDHKDYVAMKKVYNLLPKAQRFLGKYSNADVACLAFREGPRMWIMPDHIKEKIVRRLKGAYPTALSVEYRVTIKTYLGQPLPVHHSYSVPLYPHSEERRQLMEMMEGNTDLPGIRINYVLPKFVMLNRKGKFSPVKVLMGQIGDHRTRYMRNMILRARPMTTGGKESVGWELTELIDDYNFKEYLDLLPYGEVEGLFIYVFSDRIVTSLIPVLGDILTVYGIYFLFVYSIVRRLMFNHLGRYYVSQAPNIDRLHRMVKDVMIFRDYDDYYLEGIQYKFAMWAFMSKEAFVRITRYKPNPFDAIFVYTDRT